MLQVRLLHAQKFPEVMFGTLLLDKGTSYAVFFLFGGHFVNIPLINQPPKKKLPTLPLSLSFENQTVLHTWAQ